MAFFGLFLGHHTYISSTIRISNIFLLFHGHFNLESWLRVFLWSNFLLLVMGNCVYIIYTEERLHVDMMANHTCLVQVTFRDSLEVLSSAEGDRHLQRIWDDVADFQSMITLLLCSVVGDFAPWLERFHTKTGYFAGVGLDDASAIWARRLAGLHPLDGQLELLI